jgi:hypothetical protein
VSVAEINLTQAEADTLIAMEKHTANEQQTLFPASGNSINLPLVSADKREHFFLDISRGRRDLLKGTYQNRARQVVVLVRLDFGGKPHRNPDDTEIPSPHLHIYRESFGTKWAMPIPVDKFSNMSDIWKTLFDFMRFCNITKLPKIERGLLL